VVVAFISSNVPKKSTLTDVIIEETHPEFGRTGLKVSSMIRLDKVATILKDLIVGEIGEIGGSLKKEISSKICKAYCFPV